MFPSTKIMYRRTRRYCLFLFFLAFLCERSIRRGFDIRARLQRTPERVGGGSSVSYTSGARSYKRVSKTYKDIINTQTISGRFAYLFALIAWRCGWGIGILLSETIRVAEWWWIRGPPGGSLQKFGVYTHAEHDTSTKTPSPTSTNYHHNVSRLGLDIIICRVTRLGYLLDLRRIFWVTEGMPSPQCIVVQKLNSGLGSKKRKRRRLGRRRWRYSRQIIIFRCISFPNSMSIVCWNPSVIVLRTRVVGFSDVGWVISCRQVLGKGMDKLVSWLVLYNCWSWECMEGMSNFTQHRSCNSCLSREKCSVSLARTAVGRERWKKYPKFKFLVLKEPWGAWTRFSYQFMTWHY